MTKDKNPQDKITEAGAVELEESALDDASGGLLSARLGTISDKHSPIGLKIDLAPDAHKFDAISVKHKLV